jgi:Na+-transporting methylmalonyl-CoA/oxaloacetate decarboxylase gamma subunit
MYFDSFFGIGEDFLLKVLFGMTLVFISFVIIILAIRLGKALYD